MPCRRLKGTPRAQDLSNKAVDDPRAQPRFGLQMKMPKSGGCGRKGGWEKDQAKKWISQGNKQANA